MIRLPDVYYTDQFLEGTHNQNLSGGYPETPSFSQGEDVIMQFMVCYNGSPVTDGDKLSFVVKKSIHAVNVLWVAKLNEGLYSVPSADGYYKVILPSEITRNFLAGIYTYDIVYREAPGENAGPKDLDIVLNKGYFSIEYTASSPYPLSESPLPTLDRENVEPTVPIGFNTTKA